MILLRERHANYSTAALCQSQDTQQRGGIGVGIFYQPSRRLSEQRIAFIALFCVKSRVKNAEKILLKGEEITQWKQAFCLDTASDNARKIA